MMTDAHHSPVERQDMIIIVAGRESRVDHRGRTRGEVEAIETSLLRVNQRFSIGSPVRRLEGSAILMHDRRVPGCDVEDLEVAADVVAIRNESRFWRRGDPNIAERSAFDDGVVMCADEEADVDRIRK